MHDLINDKDARLSNRIAADYLRVFLSKDFLEREEPDYSRMWSIAHTSMFNTIQLLALKRGYGEREIEIARIAALLHDSYTILTGKSEDHAVKSGEIAGRFLEKYPEVKDIERNLIVDAISQHSEKDQVSDNWLVELMKDADVLDTFLHSKFGYADRVAPRERAKKIMNELGIEFEL